MIIPSRSSVFRLMEVCDYVERTVNDGHPVTPNQIAVST